jgi:tripartite-type tricarboxylate transporter receptor subunit TctC
MKKSRPIAYGVVAASLSALVALASSPATAQEWPQRSVRLILPFGAGSATDIAARLLGDKLTARWGGKSVIIENRPGGDGIVAISAFISANDDHVLLYASSASFLAHPYTLEKMTYNLERDLAPIAQVTDTVLSVSVPATSDIKTIADFVKTAKAEPEKYNTAGAAGLPQFTVEAFVKDQGLKTQNVPYRDVVQAARDLAEGRIQFLLSSVAVMVPHVQAGKARIIAIGSRQRSPLYKDVPSVVEAGYPGLVVETTAGFYGPQTMPLDLRKRIGADVIAVAKDPDIVAKIESTGQDMRTGGPEALVATIKQQTANTAAVAKILGMEKK